MRYNVKLSCKGQETVWKNLFRPKRPRRSQFLRTRLAPPGSAKPIPIDRARLKTARAPCQLSQPGYGAQCTDRAEPTEWCARVPLERQPRFPQY